jgi:hypothetical protein
MAELACDDSNPCMRKQGVDGPNFKVFGTQSSPCSFYVLKI